MMVIRALFTAIGVISLVSAQMFVHDTSKNRTASDILALCAGTKSTKAFECWDYLENGFIGTAKNGYTEDDIVDIIGDVEIGSDFLQDSNRGTLHMEETMPYPPRMQAECLDWLIDKPLPEVRVGTVVSPTLDQQDMAPYHLAFLHESYRLKCNGTEECLPNTSFRPPTTGKSTTVYMLGEDVSAMHIDLTGRVSRNRFIVGEEDLCTCAKWQGTHVAGIVAGTIHGVAKGAFVVPAVAKPGCNDDYSIRYVVRALQWIIDHRRVNSETGPAVVVSSVHASVLRSNIVAITMMEGLITTLLEMNVTVIAAAQSRDADECKFSPGRMSGVITIGGMDVFLGMDNEFAVRRWSRSNKGTCIDLWAQSTLIESALPSEDVDTTSVYTGTPQAAGIATGVAAVILDMFPSLTPSEVRERMVEWSSMMYLDEYAVVQMPWG